MHPRPVKPSITNNIFLKKKKSLYHNILLIKIFININKNINIKEIIYEFSEGNYSDDLGRHCWSY